MLHFMSRNWNKEVEAEKKKVENEDERFVRRICELNITLRDIARLSVSISQLACVFTSNLPFACDVPDNV